MQALYKMVASFLSVALIFTSAVPSFAQNRHTKNSPFKVSGRNALDNAVQKHVNKTLEQMENDTYWVNKGAAMVQQDCGGSLKCALNRLSGALNAANGNPLKVVVCSKDERECVPALAYGQGAVQYATTNALYVKGEMAVDVSPLFIKLVTQYGVHSEADRKAAQKYLFGLVQRAYKDCDKVSANEDTSIWAPKRTNYCAEEVTAMAALAMLAKNEPERKQVASAVYSLMKSEYDSVGGGMIMTGGTVALGVLGTPDAYAKLEQFLTLDTIPGTAGNVWKGLNSPIESTAQNSYKANRKDGRFLNRINEKFLYLDQSEAKRQGFPTTSWQAAGIQYPYANTLEDVGLLLGAQSAQNGSAKHLATKVIQQANQYAKTGEQMAARVHLPVVIGIMDGWRQSNTSMNVPSKELVAFLYKGNWFDINEGTQRRIHQKAYEFGLRRNMVFDPPARDPQKIHDYVNYIKVKDASFAADIAAQFVLLNAIITKLPALAKGIPNAVRALKQRSMWVGTKDLISKLPRTSPMQKAKAVTQTTAKRPIKSPVAKQPVQTAKKPVTQQMQAQVANKPNMGTESAKNTVITQTKPTKQSVQTVAKTEQPATQTSKAAPTATKPGWLAKWMPDSWKKQMVNQMLRFSLSRYGVAALGPGTMPFTTNGLVAFAKNTPKVEQMVQVAKDGFASTEALSATAGASARTGAVNPGALALQNSAKSTAAIAHLNPVTSFMKAAASAALAVGGGYTAAQMGLLPTDGSELLRLAMLPGLVVAPGAIKPMLQMAFKEGTNGTGAAQSMTPEERKKAEQEAQELLASIAKNEQKLKEENFSTTIGKSVILAPKEQRDASGNFINGGYSVTIVKTHYKGEEEIFGVIATHVLPDNTHNRIAGSLLSKKFQVKVKDNNGKDVIADAEVVQTSPSSMLDISLVRLSTNAEKLVSPLEISTEEAQKNEKLFSPGFTAGNPAEEERTVHNKSLLSIQTDQNLKGDRQGFCGSPLIDGNNQVKAIHTGTREKKDAPDVSYGTHARFINTLVEAYHNDGIGIYDFVINGQTLAKLNVDEYIASVHIFNSSKKMVAQKNIVGGNNKDTFPKFSESNLREMLNTPDATYVLLRTRKHHWSETGNTLTGFKAWKGSKEIDPTKRENWYNLKTKEILPGRPEGMKM